MRTIVKKRIISAAILFASIAASAFIWFKPNPSDAYFLVPFEGTPTNIEYNCLCSGSIMVTVQPTEATAQKGAQTVQLLYVWAADLLSNYIDFGAFPIPHAYLWCGIFWTGEHQLLGNYVTGSFPCAAYVGTGCSITGYAQGAVLNVGSSLY